MVSIGRRYDSACFIPLAIVVFGCVASVNSIGCFVCQSINGSERNCEDTFNNSGHFWQPNCMAGRRGRKGLFPATQCIKIVVHDDEKGYRMIVRTCVVDDGGLTTETEIGRLSHCGYVRSIVLNNVMYSGCLLACNTEACNTANQVFSNRNYLIVTLCCLFSALFTTLLRLPAFR